MNARNFVKAWMPWFHLSSARSDRGPIRQAQTPSYCPELDGGYLAAEFDHRRYGDGGKTFYGSMYAGGFTAWQPYMAVSQRDKERRN